MGSWKVAAVITAVLVLSVGGWLATRSRSPAPDLPTSAAASAATEASSSSPEPDTARAGRTPEVRGRILDAEGNAVSGASVRLLTPRAPYSVLRDATSAQDGTFSFARLAPGSVLVVADRDPAGFVTSAPLEARAGESADVTLVLSSTSGVRGTVVDTRQHPIANAKVAVEGVAWTVRGTTSNAAGVFRLIVVPNEASSLAAEADGYAKAHVALTDRKPGAELAVTLQLQASKGDAAAPGEPGSIEGNVQNGLGVAVPSFTLAVNRFDSASGGLVEVAAPRSFTDAQGAFRLEGLTPGVYTLIASTTGIAPKRSAPIDVKSGAAVRGVFVILAPGGSVMGHILVNDKTAKGIAGANVFFDAPDGGPSIMVTTDEEGRYHLDRAPVGSITLRVERAGFRPRRLVGLVVSQGATVTKDISLSEDSDGGSR